jgi:hypothetical protein
LGEKQLTGEKTNIFMMTSAVLYLKPYVFEEMLVFFCCTSLKILAGPGNSFVPQAELEFLNNLWGLGTE